MAMLDDYWRRNYGKRHIDFNLFWERVGTVALCQRLQVAYQVGTDEAFAARCFNAHTGTAQCRAMCTILASPTLIIGFAEDA
jgi:hypothetical protein